MTEHPTSVPPCSWPAVIRALQNTHLVGQCCICILTYFTFSYQECTTCAVSVSTVCIPSLLLDPS